MSKTKTVKRSLALAAVVMMSMSAGCTAKRVITAKAWMEANKYNTLFTAYWEGSCMGSTCTRGMSRVKQCVLNPENNALVCQQAKDAESALNPE